MYLSGVPDHIIQRDNHRAACFLLLLYDDYLYYKALLAEGLRIRRQALQLFKLQRRSWDCIISLNTKNRHPLERRFFYVLYWACKPISLSPSPE